MADEPKGLDYKDMLTGRLRQNPAWSDLANACNEVITQAVNNPQRHLASVRDSTRNRKGKILEGLRFNKDRGVVIKDHNEPDPEENQTLPPARIVRVLQNNQTNQPGDTGIDAIEVEFFLNNRKFNWIFPLDAPQERSLLIQNGYMLGFDFFNTRLSTEDYQRMYEFISLYWPEGGTDNFIRFISFIKNISLDAVPLWSYDDGTDTFPVLTEKPNDAIPTHKGGTWYQTSHVELRYDPFASDILLNPSLEDLEELFFLFAPIILVLERIVAAIQLNFDFFYALASQEHQIFQAKHQWQHADATINHNIMQGGILDDINQKRILYTWPILKGQASYLAGGEVNSIEFANADYEIPELIGQSTQGAAGIYDAYQTDRIAYTWPVLDIEATMNGAFILEAYEVSNIKYKINDLIGQMNFAAAGMIQSQHARRMLWKIPEANLNGVFTDYITEENYLFYSKFKSPIDYPDVFTNSLNLTYISTHNNLIYSIVRAVYSSGNHIVAIEHRFEVFGIVTYMSFAKASSKITIAQMSEFAAAA